MSMNYLKLRAGDTELDINPEQSISINKQILDIFDVSAAKTDFTYEIELPMTPKNNKFFKHIKENNIDNNQGFIPTISIPAVIQVGDNELIKGNLMLLKIPKDGELSGVYIVQIRGNISNIISNIEDFSLRDLDLSQFNHIRNRENIINSWDYEVATEDGTVEYGEPGHGYVYPYIVTGEWDDMKYRSYISDLFPAMYVKTLVDKLFEFSGFSYTSKFFDSTYFRKLILPFVGQKIQKPEEVLNEESTRIGVLGGASSFTELTPTLFHPEFLGSGSGDWYKSFYIHPDHTFGFSGFNEITGTVDDTSGELTFQDPLSSWDTNSYGGRYICQKTGYYNINFTGKVFIEYTNLSGGNIEYDSSNICGQYYFRLRRNGIIIYDQLEDGDPLTWIPSSFNEATPYVDVDTPLSSSMDVSDILLEEGDIITINIGIRYSSGASWVGSDEDITVRPIMYRVYDGQFSKFTVTPSDNKDMGNSLVKMSQVVPDIKLKDFLLTLRDMFNLVMVSNPDKTNDLIIEPYDDFFGSKQKVLDWDNKVDLDKEVLIKPMSEVDVRQYLFTYKEDDDYYNKQYTDETKRVYGEYKVDIRNDFSDKVDKTELIFSPTPNANKDIWSKVAPYFVSVEDNKLKPKKVKPRILFYNGTVQLPAPEFWQIMDYTDGDFTTEYKYPFVGMVDHPYTPEYDLSFGWNDTYFWNLSQIPTNNLFQMFHKSRISNLIDVNSRILEAEFKLTPTDIAEFDFRNIIFLDNSYWRVNSIQDYNPSGSDSTTKVVLYKLNKLTVYDKQSVNVPTSNSNCPSDIVSILRVSTSEAEKSLGTWVDHGYYASLSGQPISEACCTQLGGEYINGSCRIGRYIPVLDSEDNSGVPVTPRNLGSGSGNVPIVNPGTQQNKASGSNVPYNTISRGSKQYITNPQIRMALGNNITGNVSGVTGSIALGDNIDIREPYTIYTERFKINEYGIESNLLTIIDGGDDVVLPIFKTDLIDIIDGSDDAVKQLGGDSKLRPFIDGNTFDEEP